MSDQPKASANPQSRGRARIEAPDLSEKGGLKHGAPQRSDERLFMQLLAFGGCSDVRAVARHLRDGLHGESRPDVVLYEDVNDPFGIAILSITTDPAVLLDTIRPLLRTGPMAALVPKPHFTMLGRTYSLGYEPDLRDVLIERPKQTALNSAWPWAIWYPLRRSGAFARLTPEEQRVILAEHGQIGMAFGAADFAHDLRLACHGLDPADFALPGSPGPLLRRPQASLERLTRRPVLSPRVALEPCEPREDGG
jgi:chlorite dismutase